MERTQRPRKNAGWLVFALMGLALLGSAGSLPVSPVFAEPESEPRWATSLRDHIVATAASELHVREATNHNDGPDVRKYLKVTGLPEGHPWCAAFVSWVFAESNATGPRSARVVDWFQANIVYRRDWRRATITPEKGMLIGLYYPELRRYGHIGIVAENAIGRVKSITTIEGNTNNWGSREGDGVQRKLRPWNTIAVMADYCLQGNNFEKKYHQKVIEANELDKQN